MNPLKKLYYSLRLNEAIKKADQASRLNRRRYYVLPCAPKKLMVIDRNNFRRLKAKHYIPHNAMTQHLLAESFYHTPSAVGTCSLTKQEILVKKQQYLRWIELCIRNEKILRNSKKM